MSSSPAQPSHPFGDSRWPVLLILLLVIAGGIVAYRYFFNRLGEAAVQMIPGDAMRVVTLDTNASPQQVLVFRRIDDAFKREKVDTGFDDMVTSMMQNSPVAKEIRPLCAKSFAFAALNTGGPGSGPDFVLFCALKDPGKAANVLAKYGQKSTQDGLDYYQLKKENSCAAILSNYLVVSQKPGALTRVEQVRKGEAKPVVSLPEYQQARAALPADANLMVFVSPRALSKMQEAGKSRGVNPLPNTRWMAVGAAVHDKGLDAVYRVPLPSGQAAGCHRLECPPPTRVML
ncbi:MAG TPA: DUF3352 domain-containing protein [Chthonomonadaceae bacterium]|nr:DUF3352 domain-containing protein [Chthonomonadaceae bacterium]